MKWLWCFCFLISLLSGNLRAQDAIADSLAAKIQTLEGKEKSTAYADLVWRVVFSNPDTAIVIAKEGLVFARQLGNDTSISSLLNRMGVAYDISGNPEKALEVYQEAIEVARRGNVIPNEAGALNNIGLIKWNRGEWESAIDYYLQSIKLFEQSDNKAGIGNTYNNIGLILWEEHQFEEAIAYYRKSLALRKEINDDYGISASMLNLALAYSDLETTDSSMQYLRACIPIKVKVKDDFGLGKAYNNIGIEFDKLDPPLADSSLVYFGKALRIYRKSNNVNGLASSLNNLSSSLMLLGRYGEALDVLDTAITVAKEHHLGKLLYEVYWNAGKAYKGLNNLDSSFHYMELSRWAKNDLINEERSKALAEVQTKYETEKKEAEINRLAKENAESALAIAEQRSWMIGIALGALIIILALLFVYVQHRQKKNAEFVKQESEHRKKLLDATVNAQESERQRIAKDLHDGLVQQLAIIKMGFQSFGKTIDFHQPDADEFAQKIKLIDEAADEARSISHQMMPRALMEAGLVSALEDMLSKTLSAHGIVYTFEHYGLNKLEIKKNIEVGLYRIAQEMVNNIIKHSGAKTAEVQLFRMKTHLILHIEDDGKGFDLHSASKTDGIGMSNIYSRASAVNGEVNFESRTLNGTAATVRVPII